MVVIRIVKFHTLPKVTVFGKEIPEVRILMGEAIDQQGFQGGRYFVFTGEFQEIMLFPVLHNEKAITLQPLFWIQAQVTDMYCVDKNSVRHVYKIPLSVVS
jgi:hypothetical protein